MSLSKFKASFLTSLILVSIVCCRTLSPDERTLEQRDDPTGGISVGEPKVYEDAVLQQLLSAAQARLATLQVIDQTGIAARLGGLSGVSQQFSSVSFNASGTPTPGVTTTNNGATQTIQQTTKPGEVTTTSTSGAAVQNSTTTMPQITATAPSISAPAFALPAAGAAGFGVSASDLLNEEVQLTYEIANLRLLLEGSLSDQLLLTKDGNVIKPRVTLGFPISIEPNRRFKHAVAVIEAEVYSTQDDEDRTGGATAPTLISIIPREKTYNVAAITDRSTSIGAGVVTQVASFGGSFLSGRRTYYIVKDQDTVATTFQPEKVSTGFGWQFRPVLGQDIVQSGLRQTFAQISFPTMLSPKTFGRVHLRTYWRNYNSATGTLGGVVPGSLKESTKDVPIPRFDMRQDVGAFTVLRGTQDLGNGTMLVRVQGRFLTGTTVRAGTTLVDAQSGLLADNNGLRFVATLADIAKGVNVVTRDGTETPLIQTFEGTIQERPEIVSTSVTQIDEANSRLIIRTAPPTIEHLPPLVAVIGGKVFGYADAPIERTGAKAETLSLIVPTALLTSSREVTVKPLFVDSRYSISRPIFLTDPHGERLSLISQDADNLTYLLTGSRLGEYRGAGDMQVIVPKGKTLTLVGDRTEQQTMRFIVLTAKEVKEVKTLVVQRPYEKPFVIAIPAPPDPPKVTPPKFAERITVGADEAVIIGDGLDAIKKITALKRDLTDLEMDGKNLRIKGLAAAGITNTARTVDCALKNGDGKTVATIQMEIVTSKVESIPK